MIVAETKAKMEEIRKEISGKEKSIGIDKLYVELPFDPTNGFLNAQEAHENAQAHETALTASAFATPRFGEWMTTFVDDGYKDKYENFIKGFLFYYERYDGGIGEEHVVYFDWKKAAFGGHDLAIYLKPWYGNWAESGRKENVMKESGFGMIENESIKRDPIPGPPRSGVDPPPPPPPPPPTRY